MFIASQLGRTIISPSTSSADEMTAKPDESGSYGDLDEIIRMTAAETSGNDDEEPCDHEAVDGRGPGPFPVRPG